MNKHHRFRRVLMTAVLLLAAGALLAPGSWLGPDGLFGLRARADAPQRPNIILIVADDLGIVDINAYAQRFTGADPAKMFYETPNLDRLVKEGLAFSQAYACHLCSPARASIMTGKYAARTGFTTAVGGTVKTFYNQGMEPPEGYVAQDALVWQDNIEIQQALLNGTTRDALASGHPLDQGQDELTLPEALYDHRAYFIGKWHLGGHGADGWQPRDHGFQELSYFDEGGSRYFNWRATWNQRTLVFPEMPQAELRKGLSGNNFGEEYLTDELTEHAVDLIHRYADPDQPSGKPFFLNLSHFAVHTPFEGRAQDIAHFEAKPTRGWNGHNNAVYAAMLKRLDRSIGKILQALQATGQDQNTLLVFISDNGGVMYTDPLATNNAPFKSGKGTHFEGGIRVPLIIRWAGQIQGGRWSDVPVDCNDLMPTLLELTGYPVDPVVKQHDLDGRSLAGLLDDPGNAGKSYGRDTFFWHYPLNVIVKNPYDDLPSAPSSAIREGDWKLIFDWSGQLRLYNLAVDPHELNDQSETKPELAQDLFRKLNDWIDHQVAVKYTPAINPDYDPRQEARDRPFIDLRRKYLGEERAIRSPDGDPRFKLLP